MKYYYIVQKNDRLCDIAKNFNIDIKKIIKLNDLTNIDYIYEGQILLIWEDTDGDSKN